LETSSVLSVTSDWPPPFEEKEEAALGGGHRNVKGSRRQNICFNIFFI
jgi:hypothetical protein